MQGVGRFDDLSDLDFEELVADLLREMADLPFRAGTRGRDAGIDVLALADDGGEHVVQCKHYRDSTYAHLRSEAAAEAKKLEERQPAWASYRFVTSHRLNHRQRAEIAEIFSDWIDSPEAVLGENDLRARLRDHPEVEGRNVKLWLSGAGPLQRLLNAGSYERSHALLEDAREALPRYVQTEAYGQAREILHRERVCVIAGAPGVGKTTLAQLLLLDALENEFQPYEIAPDGLRDAWPLLALDEAQIFYFDDFLGQTALHESRHHDADLLRFMRRVARSPRRRFVLTTREYILRQAQMLSEALDREADEASRFLLTIEHYRRHEKARILYNHIYFSDRVDAEARRSLLRDRGYLRIVDHDSYSPRLIEWLTGWSGHRLNDEERQNYTQFCLGVLDSPHELWAHAFEQGLGDAERALLLSLLGLPRGIDERDAELVFAGACRVRSIGTHDRRFVRALAVLDDSFVTTSAHRAVVEVSFINPSVIDFLRIHLSKSQPDAQLVIRGAEFFEQVEWLWNALAGEADHPHGTYAQVLAEAFDRTLRVRPPYGGEFSNREYRWRRSKAGLVPDRLTRVLGFALDFGAFGDAAREWLAAAVADWLSAAEEGGQLDSGFQTLLLRAGELGVTDVQTGAERLKGYLVEMPPSVHRWDLLDDLHRAVPDAFSELEWAGQASEFEAFATEVLDDPGAYLNSEDDLDLLELLVQEFEVPVNDFAIDDARETLMEYDESDYEPDSDDLRDEDDWEPDEPEFGESDADLDALFERLGP